jgi:hypothetical protein
MRYEMRRIVVPRRMRRLNLQWTRMLMKEEGDQVDELVVEE